MMHRGSFSADERQIRSKIRKIMGQERIIRAGIVKMTRKCGKVNCRCAEGKGHVSYYLSMRVGKERKMVYVPRIMATKVRQWVASYKEINKAMDQLSNFSLQQLKQE
jgi:hypothetical protein